MRSVLAAVLVAALTPVVPTSPAALAAPTTRAPAPESAVTGATAVVAGGTHTCALLDDGSVRCWGDGAYGQLGYASTADIGDNETPGPAGPVNLGTGRTATQLAAGYHHTCALLDNGSVRCWGDSTYGQLGYASTADIGDNETPASAGPVSLGGPVAQIAAGGYHTCALLENDSVRCWGAGADGRLGHVSTNNLGDNEHPTAVPPVSLGGAVAQVTVGGRHTCARLVGAGAVRCWGFGPNGQLGYANGISIGDDETPATAGPVSLGSPALDVDAGRYHTCAVLVGGTVRCWGQATTYGLLGYANTVTVGDDEHPSAAGPASLGGTVTKVDAGELHTCARLSTGAVRCWGAGADGRLGYANTTTIGDNETPASVGPVNLGAGRTATQVTAGFSHSCALLDDGNVRCWGDASSGRLGYANTVPIGDDEHPAAAGPVQLLTSSLGVRKGADEVGVTAGAAIHLSITVTNTGDTPLTGITVTDPDAPDCAGPVPDLAVGTQHTIDCTHVTDAGDVGAYRNTATVDSSQTAPVDSNEVSVTVHRAGPPTAVTQVAAGSAHTCALLDDGRVRCWGDGGGGRLGYANNSMIGNDEHPSEVGPVDLGGPAVQIAAGAFHTCALLDDGGVRCWGSGLDGKLGYANTTTIGDNEHPGTVGPVNLGAGRTATQITAGSRHTCAVLDDGNVRCWGYGADGRLGYANTTTIGDNEHPGTVGSVNLGAGRTATQITAGASHTCALLDDGTARCWGDGGSGRLGYTTTVDVGDNEHPGSVGPVNVGPGRTTTQITAGDSHTCALLDDATARCWGTGSDGRLGYAGTAAIIGPSTVGPVNLGAGRTATQITAGSRHTCAVLDDGNVRCWGYGADGRLGYANTTTIGDNEHPGTVGPVDLGAGRTATQITTGASHTCALLDDGTARCWGSGTYGRLGYANTTTVGDDEHPGSVGPVQIIPPALTVDKAADETAVTPGETIHLHVTVVNTGSVAVSGIAVSDPNAPDCDGSIPDLAPGEDQTVDCVYVTGPSDVGTYTNVATADSDQTGPVASNEVSVDVAAPTDAIEVAAGGSHSCALLGDGTVRCWGNGTGGRLGYANTTSVGDDEHPYAADRVYLGAGRTATQVVAGFDHTCALLDNGAVRCWGSSTYGQLGYGNTTSVGDDETPGSVDPVDLGAGRTATQITAGYYHTCAALDDATVRCWGAGAQGRLGYGAVINVGDDETPGSVAPVNLGTGRSGVQVSAGGEHSCAVLDDATVRCWGDGASGQSGYASTADVGDDEAPGSVGPVSLGAGRTATRVVAGKYHTCAVLDNGSVRCWGQGSQGRLGYANTTTIGDNETPGSVGPVSLGAGRTAVEVVGGSVHTCARLDDGTVRCWGDGAFGQSGYATTGDVGDDEHPATAGPVDLGSGRTASRLTGGDFHSCAVLDDGTVRCWGAGGNGRLGYASTATIGDDEHSSAAGPVQLLAPPSLTIAKSADETTITAGDPIHLHLTVTNTGDHRLTGVTVTDPNAPDCGGPVPDLAPGEAHTVDCTRITDTDDTGTYTNTATADSDQTAPVDSNTIDVAVEAPPVTQGISGSVTDTVSGNPLDGIFVAVLRTSDFAIAGGAVTDTSGGFDATTPAGSYFLYLIDGTGGHARGFHGAPATVVVTTGQFSTVVGAMAPARGSLAGTLRSEASGTGIAGGWAVTLDGQTGRPGPGVVVGADGVFRIDGLPTGSHFAVYVDPSGAHRPEFFDDSLGISEAVRLTVDAGVATAADASLATSTPGTGGADLAGTVTDSATGDPIEGVWVVALEAATYALAAAAVTDADGAYHLDVATGDYKLEFVDPTATHAMEWYDDLPFTGIGEAVSVTAPGLVDEALIPTTGGLTGTVTDDPSGSPLTGAWAFAISSTGDILGGAVTGADGQYVMSGLAVGSYRITFVDPLGGRGQEYWTDSPTYDGATEVSVAPGATVIADAGLQLP